MTAVALALVAGAMLLVRVGWSGRRRIAWGGWLAAAGGLAWLTAQDGAWGLAVGGVTGIAAALVLLLHAAWLSPARVSRAQRAAPALALPRRWPDPGRRAGVFLLVVPVGFAAAQWLAFGVQALARCAGAGEADSFVLMLLLQPLLWAAIMTIQMTRSAPTRMLAAPAAAALMGTLLWSVR